MQFGSYQTFTCEILLEIKNEVEEKGRQLKLNLVEFCCTLYIAACSDIFQKHLLGKDKVFAERMCRLQVGHFFYLPQISVLEYHRSLRDQLEEKQ